MRLFAVADGMGGHDAGEVASRLALEALSGFIRRSGDDNDFSWPYGLDGNLTYEGNRLRTAIHLANRRVFRAAETNDEYNGMGTTIVGVLMNGDHCAIGHVGDSRVYLLRGGEMEQVTQDDSWAATVLAHNPRANPKELASHPMRSVLTSALGAREQVDVHLAERDLRPGDTMLLCSDGLSGPVSDERMLDIVLNSGDLPSATSRLIEMANENGGPDNITCVLARWID